MDKQKTYPPTVFLSLFPTREKRNETSPDFNMSAKINGEFKYIGSGWKKTSGTGPYLSLSVDMESLIKLIKEKQATLTSAGTPVPFTEPEKDPFAL